MAAWGLHFAGSVEISMYVVGCEPLGRADSNRKVECDAVGKVEEGLREVSYGLYIYI